MYRHETAQMRKITRSPDFLLVVDPHSHAARRMAERDIAKFEVERVVKAGAVVMIETDPDGSERWRVAGYAEGKRIEVVVEPLPPSMMVLVTAIRVG